MNVEVVHIVVILFNPEVIGMLIDIRYLVVVKTGYLSNYVYFLY
jgi:hypothetical protein